MGATATATNGGLIMASAVGQPFIAAIRPANLLHFSPLIATTDAGVSWTNGLLPQGLAPSPDSLSIAPDGHAVGLVKSGLDAEVLVNTQDLSRWTVATTARRLAVDTAGTRCGVQSLSAVLAVPATEYVGADVRTTRGGGNFRGRGRGLASRGPEPSREAAPWTG